MIKQIVHLSHVELFTQPSRGWANLNKIAEEMVKLGAIDEESAVPLGRLARVCEMDLGQMSRLIKDKGGFVRVRVVNYSTKSVTSKGVYYLVDPFLKVAQSESAARFYPKVAASVLDGSDSRLIKEVIYQQEAEDVTREAHVRVDPVIAGRMAVAGIARTDVMHIPVAKFADVSVDELVSGVMDTFGDAIKGLIVNGDTSTADLADNDLNKLVIALSKIVFKATNNYYHALTIQAERELK